LKRKLFPANICTYNVGLSNIHKVCHYSSAMKVCVINK